MQPGQQSGVFPRSSVLVVCFDNLGDLVFTSALFPPLRAAFPRARLGLWCKAYARPLAELVPDADEVFASDPFWDKAPGQGKGSLRRFTRELFRVADRDYETALIVSLRWQAAAAARLAGARERIGAQGRRNRPWLTTCLPARDRARPVLEDMGRLLVPLGLPAGPLVYRLHPPPPLPHPVPALTVVLHPFASQATRCANLTVWASFAQSLAADGWAVVWFGTPLELARLRAEQGGHVEGHGFADDLTGGDLLAGVSLIAAAHAFVGNDSGPMHVAAALGVPTLGVFTPGEPLRTFPQGPGPSDVLVRDAPVGVTPDDLVRAFARLRSVQRPESTRTRDLEIRS